MTFDEIINDVRFRYVDSSEDSDIIYVYIFLNNDGDYIVKFAMCYGLYHPQVYCINNDESAYNIFDICTDSFIKEFESKVAKNSIDVRRSIDSIEYPDNDCICEF